MRGSDRPRITGDTGDDNSRPESLIKVNSFLKRFLDIKSLKVTGRDVERTTIEKSLINISNKVDDIAKIFTKKKEVDKKDRVTENNEEKENDANDERQRKVAEKKERRDRERDSEKPKKSSSIRLPEPRTGILDGIKKFMSNVISGFLLIKLATLTPLFQTISRLIVPVGKFLYEFGKKLLDGLVSFIDFGYKAYDFARGTVGNLFGEGAVKHFDKFSSTLNTFLNLAIITALTAASSFHKHRGEVGIKGTGPGRSRYGAEAGTARRYMRRFGRTAALRKFGTDAVRSLGPEATVRNQIKRTVTTSARNFAQGTGTRLMNTGAAQAAKNSSVANAAKTLIPRAAVIPIIGGVLEFGLSLLAGDPIGKAAFRGIGASLGTWVGGALGSLLGPGIGTAIGVFLGSQGGATLAGMLYDAVFGKKTKVNTKTKARSRGGEVGDDTPELSKKYYPVNLSKPTADRFESEEHIGNDLVHVEYFGPILASTSRLFVEGNKRLISKEYDNIGKGLMLMFKDYNLVSDEKLFELYRDKTLQKIFETEFKKKHDVKNKDAFGSKDSKDPIDPVYTGDSGGYGDEENLSAYEKNRRRQQKHRFPSGNNKDSGDNNSGEVLGGGDLKTAIRQLESGNDYSSMYARNRVTFPRGKEDITKMTIDDVHDLQTDYLSHQAALGYGEEHRSAAMGAYQMLEVKAVAKGMRFDTSSTLFNKETQDRMSDYYLNYSGYQEWKSRKIGDAEFNDRLAGQFASIKETSGRGAYDGDGMNNAYGDLMPLLKQIKGSEPINLEYGAIIPGKKAEGVSKNISRYASYEQGSESSVVVMMTNNNIVSAPSSNSPMVIPVRIGSSDSRDQELLDMIG